MAGDLQRRRLPCPDLAARHAQRGSPVFLYDFAWPLAVTGGTPHAACVPFVFGTHRHPHLAAKIDADDAADALSRSMMAAWAAFVRDGAPAMPNWPHLNPGLPVDASAAMTIDGNGMLFRPLHGAARLASWPAMGIIDDAD
ncbi:carboxylesterase family protein [Aminobacter sp. UC22_36]|uniref:carboxylesterase family protein n=1 Tax=Aminobacter sp. UC22_36 TaxID=3374549 RepID=UPI003756A82D